MLSVLLITNLVWDSHSKILSYQTSHKCLWNFENQKDAGPGPQHFLVGSLPMGQVLSAETSPGMLCGQALTLGPAIVKGPWEHRVSRRWTHFLGWTSLSYPWTLRPTVSQVGMEIRPETIMYILQSMGFSLLGLWFCLQRASWFTIPSFLEFIVQN